MIKTFSRQENTLINRLVNTMVAGKTFTIGVLIEEYLKGLVWTFQ